MITITLVKMILLVSVIVAITIIKMIILMIVMITPYWPSWVTATLSTLHQICIFASTRIHIASKDNTFTLLVLIMARAYTLHLLFYFSTSFSCHHHLNHHHRKNHWDLRCIFVATRIHITRYIVSSHHHLVFINIISIIVTAKYHCHRYFCRQAHTHEVFSSSSYHHHIYGLDYCHPHSSSPSSAKT